MRIIKLDGQWTSKYVNGYEMNVEGKRRRIGTKKQVVGYY